MTELIVEEVNETVIEIEGGPTLSTTVDETVQTVVQEFTDPIIIDLNSGPRGEPGAAILTGLYPPDTMLGVMGDMYIVTQGAVLVGQVFRKTTPATWTDVGNVRGPAGGVNSVNGYTGPDVLLTKADVGLGNVDNTSDLNKPVPTAVQTALDNTVKLTGAQTIAGVKTFSSAPVVPINAFAIDRITGLQADLNTRALDSVVVKMTGNQTIAGNKTFSDGLVANAGVTTTAISMTGTLRVAPTGNASVEIGRVDGVASTPFIDFHAGATLTDYDARIIVNTGTGAAGQGAMQFVAGSYSFSTGAITGNGSGLTALNGSQVTTGTVADARLSTNVALKSGATFTGAIIVPTPTADTHASTKKYVDDRIIQLTTGAPALLDTLDELAAALGDDPNFATTVTNNIATKAPLASPTFTGTVSGITKTMVGLGNVDNTTDLLKPISTATQTALNLKSNLASPTFTGTVTAPTFSGAFSGSGANVTTINGSNISTGTVADARLSSNVVLLTGTQTMSGRKVFSRNETALSYTNTTIEVQNSTGPPSVGFHYAGAAAAVLRIDYTGAFEFADINGTLYAPIRASLITAITGFAGPGTAITSLNASSLTTGTVAIARLPSTAVHRVVHTGTAWPARPTGATYVEWVGPVVPAAATANDTWVNTSA